MVITPYSSPSEGNNQQPNSQPLNGVIQPYSSQPGFQERTNFNPTPTPAPATTQQPNNNNFLQTTEKGVSNAFSSIGQGISNVDNTINQGINIFGNLPGIKQATQYAKQAFSTIVNDHINGGQSIAQQFNDTIQNFKPFGVSAGEVVKNDQPNVQQLATNQNPHDNTWFSNLNRDAGMAMLSLINGATINRQLPANSQPRNLPEKILYGVTNALGNIYTIGKLQHTFSSLAYGNATVQSILEQYPKLTFLPGFLSQVAGFDIRSQLDPATKNRFSQFLEDASLAAVQQGTGNIPNVGKIPAFVMSSPLNFGIFFGLAKLHGASNQDALIAGGIGAGLDLGSRLHQAAFSARMQNGTLHMTPDEALANVPGSELENTPIGRDILKAALEARANGQELDLNLNTTKESPVNEFLGKTYRGVNYTINLTDVIPGDNNHSIMDQIKSVVNDQTGAVNIGMINGDKPILSLEQEAAKEAYMKGNKEAVNSIQSAGEHMAGGIEAIHANYEDAVNAGDYDLARQIANQSGDQTIISASNTLPSQAYKEPANIPNSEAGNIDFFAKVEMPAITKEIQGFLSQIPEEEINKDAGGVVENPQIISGTLDDAVTQQQVEEALKGLPPITVKLGTTFIAKSSNNEQLRISVQHPVFDVIQNRLNIPQTNNNSNTPYILMANLQPGAGQQYAQSTALEGLPITLPELTFNTKSGNQITIPLSSPVENQPSTGELKTPTQLTASNIKPTTIPSNGLSPAKQTTPGEITPSIQKSGGANPSITPSFSVGLPKETGNETGQIKEAIKTGQRQTALKLYNGYRLKGKYLPAFPVIHQEALTEMKTTRQRLEGITSYIKTLPQNTPGAATVMEAVKTLRNHYKEVYAKPEGLKPSQMEYNAAHGEVTKFEKSEEIVINLTDAKSFKEFTHQTALLAREYGGSFTQLYDKIESGVITKEEYDNFKTYYQSIQTESNKGEGVSAGNQSQSPTNNQAGSKPVQSAENRQPVQNSTNAGQPESTTRGNTPDSHDQTGEVRTGSEDRNEPNSAASTGNQVSRNSGNDASTAKPNEPSANRAGGNEQLIPEEEGDTQAGLYDTLPETIQKWVKPTDNLIKDIINPQDFKNFTNIVTDENLVSFKRSLEEGKLEPVIINKTESGIGVVDGQHRLNAAKQLGLKEYPAIIIDNSNKLTLQPSKATDLAEHNAERVNAGLEHQTGNLKNPAKPVITRSDIKTLIENNSEFKVNPVLTVELGSDGKYLAFNGEKSRFNISTKALGLNGDKLEVGQEIKVNPDTLKGTVKQMRVYSGSSVYASKAASPIGSFEKVPEGKSEASNFKLFKEVEGLVDKYAKLIGEGYVDRGAIGVYLPDTKNIRVTGMNDLSVASHEITHFLDLNNAISKRIMEVTGSTRDGKPIYSAKSAPLRKEMTKLYTKYYPGGKKTHSLKVRTIEGFATLLQKYVEMPSTIAAEFPNLVKSFLQPEGQYYKPVMGEIIKDLRQIVSKYQGLDALDKVGARVTSEKNPIQKDSYFNFRDKLRNTFVDSIWNFEKLSNLAGKGRTIDDPSMWMRFAPNHAAIFGNNISSNKGYFAYRDGEFRKVADANWNTLIKGLDKEKQLDSFGYYLVARDQYFNWQQLDKLKEVYGQKAMALDQLRIDAVQKEIEFLSIQGVRELMQEANKARQDYINQKKVLDNNGFTRAEIEDAYNQNNTRWTKEEKLFDTLTSEMLKLANHPDVMLLSPDQYDKLSSKEGYASMKRQIYDELVGDKETPNQLNVGKTKISSLIQRRGGTNTIINPLYNALTNEAEILKKSLTQIVYNKMGIIAKEANFPDLFQHIQVKTAVDNTGHISFPQERDRNIIMARNNYKRYPILTDNKIKSAVDDLLTYQHMHLVDQLLVGSNRFFTHGTTALYTQFALTNFIRHQVDASAQSQNRYIPLYQPLRTLTDVLIRRNSQEAKWGVEYLTLGGMKQTLAGWQDQSPAELMKTITNERNGLIKAIDLLDKGMNVLAIPAKYTEITTRMGEYISSRKAGHPQIVALEDAGRVTAPFHHIGTWGGKRGQAFVKSTPFFNADLQYMDQALRSLANPKTRGRYIFMTALVIASMVAAGQYLLHFGSKDQKQTYKDLQPNDLGRYIWLPSPDGKTLLKFPMPQQMTPIGTMINMLLMQQFEHANYSIPDFLQGAGVFLPNPLNVTDFGRFITTYMPQFIKPAFEVAANVRDYPQFMPLVSQSLQGLPPALQFNKGTSPLALKLGQMLNLSPIKIDYLILGYLGRAAGYVTGRPANFNLLGGVTQAQYFEGGRTIQNFYDQKQTNDQLYSAAYRGITKLGSQKDTVIRNHEYDLLIGRELTAYRKLDINTNPQKASQMREQILQLIDKRNHK